MRTRKEGFARATIPGLIFRCYYFHSGQNILCFFPVVNT